MHRSADQYLCMGATIQRCWPPTLASARSVGSVAQVISPCEAGFVLNTSKGPAHPWRRLPFFLQVVRYFQEVKLVLHTLPSKCVSVSASQRHNCAQWTMLLLAQRADRYLARRLRKYLLADWRF